MEFALCTVESGGTIVLPDPGYPDYFSAVALANAQHVSFSGFDASADAMYLNFPSNPTAATAPAGVFAEAVRWAELNGAWILHDFAYGDLVFDGREPQSFLATEGAREVGVELFSMSKTYGMAGWRLGFALGNAELVRRIEELQDHAFAGIFRPVQEAGIAALTGPQISVEQRRAAYETRRDRALEALTGLECQSEGTFFVWFRLPDGLTVERLLDEHRVAVAPGEGFGSRGTGFARLSLAVGDDILDRGLQRIRAALA
jgi:aminotransferase